MSNEMSNPASKFLNWKSDHQKFAYYDKAEEKNVLIELPFKFLAIARYKTIKGWNQKKEGAIIANEVKSLKDDFTVNFYKKGQEKQQIAKGPWNDIKETVEMWDGKYTESVYVMLPDGELVNLQLSGASLSTWFEFQKNQSDKFFEHWVEVKGFKEGKTGAVSYTFPVFEWGNRLNGKEMKLAEDADGLIESYEKAYFTAQPEAEPRANSEVDKYNAKRERVDAENDMHRALQPTPPVEMDRQVAAYDPDDLPF